MLALAIAINNPFPYSGFMMVYFNMTDDDREVGFYAGLIVSSFSLGQVFSSFPSGILGDKHSGKLVLVIGLWALIIGQLLFGFAPTFGIALLARFATGILCGIGPIAKSMVPDLVPETEQGTAMNYISATWLAGTIAGPSIGGLLSGTDPGGTSWMATFPYALPNLVSAAVATFALLAVCAFVPRLGRGRAAAAGAGVELHAPEVSTPAPHSSSPRRRLRPS